MKRPEMRELSVATIFGHWLNRKRLHVTESVFHAGDTSTTVFVEYYTRRWRYPTTVVTRVWTDTTSRKKGF